MKTAIIYGSTTGNTKMIADILSSQLSAEAFDVSTKPTEVLDNAEFILLGTSTWGCGDLQDDWVDYIETIDTINWEGKTVALFGLGDSSSYSDTFVDGMGVLYQKLKDKPCRIIGFTKSDSYDFDSSIACIDDKFCGLVIDEDNESNMTNERINNWVKQLQSEL